MLVYLSMLFDFPTITLCAALRHKQIHSYITGTALKKWELLKISNFEEKIIISSVF